MNEIVLTFHCAAGEAEAIATSLRSAAGVPVHVRKETVHGRDFRDADLGELVSGRLQRAAIELVVSADDAERLTHAVAAAPRSHPVRWHAVPVAARGRIT